MLSCSDPGCPRTSPWIVCVICHPCDCLRHVAYSFPCQQRLRCEGKGGELQALTHFRKIHPKRNYSDFETCPCTGNDASANLSLDSLPLAEVTDQHSGNISSLSMDDSPDNDNAGEDDVLPTGVRAREGHNIPWYSNDLAASCVPANLDSLPDSFKDFLGSHKTVLDGARVAILNEMVDSNSGQHDPSSISLHDADLMWSITTLSRVVPYSWRSLLCHVLHLLVTRPSRPVPPSTVIANIPTDMQSLRAHLIDGPQCLLGKLPMPPMVELPNGGVFLRLKHVIQFAMSFNSGAYPMVVMPGGEITPPPIQPNMYSGVPCLTLDQTPKAKEIAQNCSSQHPGMVVCCLPAIIWSDDVDPSSNIVTATRASVHVNTMTISAYHPSGVIRRNSFVTAIQPKGENYHIMETHLRQDLHELRSSDTLHVFHSGLGVNVPVHLEVFGILMDVPERRHIAGIAGQGSHVVTRWRYASLLHEEDIFEKLQSCASCYARRVDRASTFGQVACDVCCDWDMCRRPDLLTPALPKNYPDPVPEEPSFRKTMAPQRMTFPQLKWACELACKQVLKQEWDEKEMEAYLTNHGVVKALITEIANSLQDFIKSENMTEEAAEHMIQQFLSDLNGVTLPSFWMIEGLDLEDCLDVVMHMIFLGVVKSQTKLTMKWLKVARRFATFCKRFGGLLDTAAGNYKISWLRLRSYGNGGLGGWVSDNHLAHCRVYLWFYSHLQSLRPEETPPDPDKELDDLDSWLVKDMKLWLGNRDIKQTGLKADLKDRIEENIRQPGGPTPRTMPKGGSPARVLNCIRSVSRLVSLIMQRTTNREHQDAVDRAVKLLLSDITRLCDAMPAPVTNPEPEVLRKTNLLSLLNLPGAIAKYGPPCLWWEGGQMGEGILKTIKAAYKGQVTNWAPNLMSRLYKDFALQHILGEIWTAKKDDESESNHVPGYKYTAPNRVKTLGLELDTDAFFWYQTVQEVEMAIKDGKLISGVVLHDELFACMVRGVTDGLVPIRFEDAQGRFGNSFGIWFSPVSIIDNPGEIPVPSNPSMIDYFALLPEFGKKGTVLKSHDVGVRYYCILSSWRERQYGGHLQLHGH